MGATTQIQQGEDLEFIFDLDGEDISGWVCLMEVKVFPGDTAPISRVIPPGDREWPGFLTQAETAALPIGSHVLLAKLSNASTDQERQIIKRFHVIEAWL